MPATLLCLRAFLLSIVLLVGLSALKLEALASIAAMLVLATLAAGFVALCVESLLGSSRPRR
jgi:hypothetical protein